MAQPRIFVTRRIPEPGMQMVQDYGQATVWPGELPPPRDTVLADAAGKDGILSLLTTPIDREVMERAGAGLKVITRLFRYGRGETLPSLPFLALPIPKGSGNRTKLTPEYCDKELQDEKSRWSQCKDSTTIK